MLRKLGQVIFIYLILSSSIMAKNRKQLNPQVNIIEQICEPNTIYVVNDNFHLSDDNVDTLTIPEGCVFEFRGGSISEGIVKGNYTEIYADRTLIFGEELTLDGTWNVDDACMEWFGAVGSPEPVVRSCSRDIQRALDSPFPILSLGIGYFYIDKPLELTKVKTIYMAGNESLPLEPKRAKAYKDKTLFGTVLWTDKDINVLEVRMNSLGTTLYDTHTFYIDGGTIDVTKCGDYSHSAIALFKSKENNSNVYPYLRTCLLGPFERDNTSSTGTGICFSEESTQGLGAFYGGVVQCYINGFRTAVKHDFTQAWITNIEYHCAIDNSLHAYDFGQAGNSGGLVDGWVQPLCIFEENNDEAIIVGNLRNLTISAKMWDVYNKVLRYSERSYTNQWIAKIEHATECPTITGRCVDSYERFKNPGYALMKMPVFEPDALNYRSEQRLNYIRYIDNSLLGFSGIQVYAENCNYKGNIIEGNGSFVDCSDSAYVHIVLSDFTNAIGLPRLLVLTFNDNQQVNFMKKCRFQTYSSDGAMLEEKNVFYDGNPRYNEQAVMTFAPKQPNNVRKIVIELSNPSNLYAKSCAYRLEGRFTGKERYRQTGRMLVSSDKDRPQMVTKGFQVYDRTYQKPIYMNDLGQWNDANGYTPAPNRGPSKNRPKFLTEQDAGFLYYDTSNGCFIFWDGKIWKDFQKGTEIKE